MAVMAMEQQAEHQGTPGYWRLVIVLMLIYTYAFIDRMILALLVEPIKADLGASDLQMSLLLGIAFAVFYGVFSIPAGHYVDRVNRKRLIAIASVAWAAMTIVCGTATSIEQLFAGRVGVGIAEAVITPAAFSLIRDAVPTKSRGLAFSIFAMAPMLGGSASLIGGSALLHASKAGVFVGVPFLGGLEPWQCTLVMVGLCGLPFSLLLLMMPEPARARAPMSQGDRDESMTAGLGIAARYMLSRWTVYLPLVAFATFGAMMSLSKGAWLPTAFGRRWALTPDQFGPTLGALTLVGGVLGLLVTGAVMNRLTRRGGDIRLFGAFAVLMTAIGVGGAMIAPTATLAYVFAAVGLFFVGSSYAVGATTLAELTPVAMMGRVSALYLLFQTLIGQALGPLIVALAAGALFSGTRALPYALALCLAVFAVVAITSAIALGRAVRAART